MSAQPNEFDPQDRNPAARLHEMDRLRLLRQPGAGTRMAERLRQAEATGNYHEVAVPKDRTDGRHDEPACSLPHPFQTFAVEGDPDGYCADCRAQQDTINQDAREQRKRSQRRRQRLISLFGMSIPDWVRDVVIMLSMDAALLFFAWNVGR